MKGLKENHFRYGPILIILGVASAVVGCINFWRPQRTEAVEDMASARAGAGWVRRWLRAECKRPVGQGG